MEYRKFLEQFESTVQRKAGDGIRVFVSGSFKNNGKRIHHISFHAYGRNISPAICLDGYYEQYCSGKSIEALADCVMEQYEKSDRTGTVDVSFYTDFERVKTQVACKLVNYERNRELLERIPHRRFHDLAVVYYCRTDHAMLGKGSILIHNNHLDLWGVDTQQVHEAAFFNTPRLLPYRLFDVADILEENFGGMRGGWRESQEISMYVLTNAEKYWGAVTIIYSTILEEVAKHIGRDFYVLPSSIHECMIVPVQKKLKAEALRGMVRDVNRSCVSLEDILGDSVYLYRMEEKELEMII